MDCDNQPRADDAACPSSADAGSLPLAPQRGRRTSFVLAILFLCGLVQYPVHCHLESSGVIGLGPPGGINDIVAVSSAFAFYSSIGGLIGWLIGYAVSGKPTGSIVGAILGIVILYCLLL